VDSVPGPASLYLQLRDAITRVSPVEHGLAPTAELPHVWGVLVDVGLPDGPVTVVAIADGTTSLYLGNGGATVGVGELPHIRALAATLLRAVDAAVPNLPPGWETPVPPTGWLQVVALTYQGMLVGQAAIPEVVSGGHPLSEIWTQAGETGAAISALDPGGATVADGPTEVRR
jgi:hypothetical protein